MKLVSAPRIGNGRCAPPEDTVKRLEAALGAVCPFRYVEQKVSDTLYWGTLVLDALEFPPMGKGVSPLLCKASTLAEGAEWLALRRRRSLEGYVEAHQDDVAEAVRVEELLAHIATATPRVLARVKALEAARHWVGGSSLISGREVKVPLEYVHYIGGTNGVGAGNCVEEAIVQGANEVLERRAVITVVKNRMVVPTFNLDTIGNTVLRRQLGFLRDQGVDVTVKDLSFGGALPCVGTYLVNRAVPPDRQAHRVLKAAASSDREAALASCLAEYAQVFRLGSPREEALARDDLGLLCQKDDTDNFLPLFWFGYIPYADAAFLEAGPTVPFDKGPAFDNCLDDIERVKALCGHLDKDCVVVDLTDPAVGFPVVQVVIPGYSDILPYHPPSSPVLFKGWTRDTVMGYCRRGDKPEPCSAAGMFPLWT